MGKPGILTTISVTLKYLSIISLFGLFGIVLMNVILRSLFGISLVWTFEVAQLLIIWVAFLGAAIAFFLREDGHIQVRIFIEKLPPSGRKALQILCNVLSIGVLSVILIGALERSPSAWETTRGVVQWLSFGWYYLGLIVGVVFSMIFLLFWTYDIIANKHNPEEKDS